MKFNNLQKTYSEVIMILTKDFDSTKETRNVSLSTCKVLSTALPDVFKRKRFMFAAYLSRSDNREVVDSRT